MKITINPSTGELSFDVDAQNPVQVAAALKLARQFRDGKEVEDTARSLLVFPDDDDELPAEDLIVPANVAAKEEERVAASLESREQFETWLYLRRNDRVRGVALTGVAHRFKLSSSAASSRCITLMKAGYAVRIGRGYYRAVTPSDN